MFHSKFEKALSTILQNKNTKKKYNYIQHKTYTPDYIIEHEGVTYLIEAKGRFRNSAEARKYIDIRACLPVNHSLLFVFQNDTIPMPNSAKRKSGDRFTHGDWATKHGFKWCHWMEIKQFLKGL